MFKRQDKARVNMHVTAEQLDEALTFVNKKHVIDGGHFEIAREKFHQETFKIFKEVFFVDEPTCKSLEVDWDENLGSFIMEKIKENLSVIAVDDTTGEIMAIRVLAKAAVDEPPPDLSQIKDEKIRKIFSFFNYMTEKTDFKNRFGASDSLDCFALTVVEKYRNRGLASKLMAATIDLLRYLKLENLYMKTVGTSNYSQRIFEKLGFETVFQIDFKDYVVDGEMIFNNTGVHKRVVSYVLKI